METSLLHFCAIVAVMKAEVGRRHILFIEFREFQQCEAQTFALGSTL